MKKEGNKPLDLDTPLLSLNALVDIFEIEEYERGNAIALIMMMTEEENKSNASKGLVHAYNEIIKKLPEGVVKKITQVLEKIAAARKSFLQDQERIFFSLDDAVDAMIENKSIPARLVKAMLGGKWPEHPFNFCCVDSFMIEEDGTLVPDDGMGDSAPGPDFQLQFKMVNDPINPLGSEGDR